MNISFRALLFIYTTCFLVITSMSSCISGRKLDAHVAKEFGNQLPKPKKMKQDDIIVKSALVAKNNNISNSVRKTSKVLPLIIYWQYDYRHTCTLNPEIALTHFSNTVNSSSGKLNQKLEGKELELVIEQAPTAFAIVDKGHILLLVQ